MSKHYIHSTCGQPVVFKFFKDREKGSAQTTNEPLIDPVTKKQFEIRVGGGAYVWMPHEHGPRKVHITEVTEQQLEMLNKHPTYLDMKARGFFTEHEQDHIVADSKGNPVDMERHDNTAQIADKEHAEGTDPRVDHASTRATTGIKNQDAGAQPVGSLEGEYGPIYL